MSEKTIKWSDYDDNDIARFITELYAEQEKRHDWKRKFLRKKVEEMLTEEGMTLGEVFGKDGKGRSRPKGKKAIRPAKYRNPDNDTETWTGAGRKPTWLVEALASGGKLEDFAV